MAGHPTCTHRVFYPGENGRRCKKVFTSETAAMAFAEKKRRELGINGTSFGTVSNDERSALDCWRAFAAETPTAPDLLVMVRQYVKEWKDRNASITVSRALEIYVRHLESERASDVHVKTVSHRVGRLAEEFGDKLVSAIDEGTFADWFNGLRNTRPDKLGEKPSITTRDNSKRTCRTFFAFCMARGWITSNPVPIVSRKKTKAHRVARNKAPEIMMPGDVQKFLLTVEEIAAPILPFWLLKFFAGVRDAEAARLDWSMVSLKKKIITIPAEASKTGDERIVAILPMLAEWLAPYEMKSGPLAPTASKRRYYYRKTLKHLRRPDKIEGKQKRGAPPKSFKFPSNAARHSFATYHLYHFRNAGETSMQLGHKGNPSMLWEHYANPSAQEYASSFWEITSSKKIVQITKEKRLA